MTRLILEFSAPRTGSNALSGILRTSSKVFGFTEVFHPKFKWETGRAACSFFGEDNLVGKTGPTALAEHMERLRHYNPKGIIQYLLDEAEQRSFAAIQIKIFPGHLGLSQIDQIIASFEPICYVLTRRPVDMYISNLKAMSMKSWAQANTTDIKPTIDLPGFLDWHARTRRHYQGCLFCMQRHGHTFAELTYNDLFESDNGPAECLTQFYEQLGVSIDAPDSKPSAYAKQDLSTSINDKVANWESFHTAVTAADQEPKLNGFQLDQPTIGLTAELYADRIVSRKRLRSLRNSTRAIFKRK